MVELMACYATCPKGLEDLLTDEIAQTGSKVTRQSIGVVYFEANHGQAYRLCLWSRVANRVVLLLLASEQSEAIENDLALYSAISAIAWEEHLTVNQTFAVDFVGTNKAISHSQFGAMRVKDAVVDRMRAKEGERPDVDTDNPDMRIQVRLAKSRLQVGLDLSGGSLHQRGYRSEQGAAPLKENLAAAILLRLGWHNLCREGFHLVDPMCGSGTFLIEAALIALDWAPGLKRKKFGFMAWQRYQPAIWQTLVLEAEARLSAGRERWGNEIKIWGFDQNEKMIAVAKANAQRANLAGLIEVTRRSIDEQKQSQNPLNERGLVICNPPYGERLGEAEQLRHTYFSLANYVKAQFPNWTFAVLTSNRELAREMRLRPKKINKFYNGAIACELLSYDLLPAAEAELRQHQDVFKADELREGAQMVFNRIRKNLRKLTPWLSQVQTDAYRLYDADLPEYAAAVDVYAGELHVQEYAAPKTVDSNAANRRLRELLTALSALFDCSVKDISVKTRQKNKGLAQYEKVASENRFVTVYEDKAKFLVNLYDYLDTGLFLDHRPLRRRVFAEAAGKRVLNLFCYTGSISVQAALGGAKSTTSVDMSQTYLNWAKKNLTLNRIHSDKHTLIQADCLKWLNQCREGFDLIVLDPPSFSNSKRMEGVLDIQRDHVALVRRCMDLISPSGRLYFSNNLRGFKLDYQKLEPYEITDITNETIDLDFQRNAKIHHCYEVCHKEV